jgi:hypothetical protein
MLRQMVTQSGDYGKCSSREDKDDDNKTHSKGKTNESAAEGT